MRMLDADMLAAREALRTRERSVWHMMVSRTCRLVGGSTDITRAPSSLARGARYRFMVAGPGGRRTRG